MQKQEPSRACRICGREISPARLEVLPDTSLCVDCARIYPPAPIDIAKLDLSQASPITRNGFGPKD
ncbi:MAG TPA: TraR/DksA C4-type zinc finger protein [Phycisphaerae bacterium]|jgi:hypothetical protein|nr:TraR/DksA C4-type zinc finger protein [Phycisphaerae bacterium]